VRCVTFFAVIAVGLSAPFGARGEPATARYAPAQLEVARDFLDRARDAALLGESALAGRFAWQASVDARLAWGMSDSAAVRVPAAQIYEEANRIAHQAAMR